MSISLILLIIDIIIKLPLLIQTFRKIFEGLAKKPLGLRVGYLMRFQTIVQDLADAQEAPQQVYAAKTATAVQALKSFADDLDEKVG